MVLLMHACLGDQLPTEHLRISADLMDEVNRLAEDSVVLPKPTQSAEELAVCICEHRTKDGRACSTDAAANKISETAKKGCNEELAGMPSTSFKEQALRDCVCRVQTSAGLPCVDPAEESRRAEEDEKYKKLCAEQHQEALQAPVKRAAEVKACVCNWAEDVMPGLCNTVEQSAADRTQIDSIADNCEAAEDQTEKEVRACVCAARKTAKIPCLRSAEWTKMRSAVAAQHATCVKVNRRRRANGGDSEPVAPPPPPRRDTKPTAPAPPKRDSKPTAPAPPPAEPEDMAAPPEEGEEEPEDEGEEEPFEGDDERDEM
jgi:hypothetical protein